MLKVLLSMLLGVLVVKMNWWMSCFYLISLMVLFIGYVPLVELVKIVGLNVYMDTLSFSLCYLTLWLTILMYIASNYILKVKNSFELFSLLIYGLALILLISFMTSNYLMFYFFFEVSLIPTLLIITGWGFQPERLQAGLYFMLYTLTASLPLLVSLFYLYTMIGSLTMYLEASIFTSSYGFSSIILALSLLMAFLVKMPMFLVHLWLPKAHVEAPVAGSMILAGVLLKLGGYGVCRVFNKVYFMSMTLGPYIIGLSLFGMVYVGMMCCRLNDMKALVAYSSVAHMGLVLSGLFSSYIWGMSGGLMMMISHGISSSGLFCIVNIYYERLGSRSMFISKGLLILFPLLSLMMFMLCGSNISAPPTINLLSEIFLMLSVMSYDMAMMLAFPLGSFLGAVFTFYLFSYSQHGKFCNTSMNLISPKFSEYHSLVMHLLPLNFIVLKPEVFFYWL